MKHNIKIIDKTPNEKMCYLEVFMAGALWSLIGVFLKEMANCGCSEGMSTFLRFAISFIVYFMYTALMYGIKSFILPFKVILGYSIYAIVCFGLNTVAYMYAVMYNGVGMAAVILNINPIFTAIVAQIMFKEKMTIKKILGIFINITGCIVAVTGGTLSLGGLTFFGILMGVMSAFMYSLTPAGIKLSFKGGNVMVFNTYCMLVGTITIMLTTRPFETTYDFSIEMILWSLAYAFMCTVIPNVIYTNGTRGIKETSRIPVIASIETILSVVWGIFLYSETIGIVNMVGIAMVVGSIVLFSNENK